MTGVVVYLVTVIAFAAVLCGHQGEPFPPGRWVRAARARARRQAGVSRPHGPVRLPLHPRDAPGPPQSHTEPQPRPAPAWADTKEAA